MQRHYIVKKIGNVSDWLYYAGGALIKVADIAGSTVVSWVIPLGMYHFKGKNHALKYSQISKTV